MNDQTPIDPGNTEFVLPIVCPNCKHELDLSMAFALLPPKVVTTGETEDVTEEEA